MGFDVNVSSQDSVDMLKQFINRLQEQIDFYKSQGAKQGVKEQAVKVAKVVGIIFAAFLVIVHPLLTLIGVGVGYKTSDAIQKHVVDPLKKASGALEESEKSFFKGSAALGAFLLASSSAALLLGTAAGYSLKRVDPVAAT